MFCAVFFSVSVCVFSTLDIAVNISLCVSICDWSSRNCMFSSWLWSRELWVLSTGDALLDELEEVDVLELLVAGGAVAVVVEPPDAVVAEGLAE